jgi:hypothetical protein
MAQQRRVEFCWWLDIGVESLKLEEDGPMMTGSLISETVELKGI